VWTPDPWVGRRSSAAAGEERCKRSWAWVLECVLSPQCCGMVSREACCRSRVPGPQPFATRRLLLPLPTLALQWIPKTSQLPTQEIEKQPRLPTLGPRVGMWNAPRLLQKSPVKETIFCKSDLYCIKSSEATPTTGWRRCISCLKLQVSLRQRATNYRGLLRKMTYKDKASCGC